MKPISIELSINTILPHSHTSSPIPPLIPPSPHPSLFLYALTTRKHTTRRAQECERVGCTANSEMVRQLVRRAQLLAPLPRHRTQGLTRHEMLETAFAHLDVDGRRTSAHPAPPPPPPPPHQ